MSNVQCPNVPMPINPAMIPLLREMPTLTLNSTEPHLVCRLPSVLRRAAIWAGANEVISKTRKGITNGIMHERLNQLNPMP
jgi:hypothetical protein